MVDVRIMKDFGGGVFLLRNLSVIRKKSERKPFSSPISASLEWHCASISRQSLSESVAPCESCLGAVVSLAVEAVAVAAVGVAVAVVADVGARCSARRA